MGLFLSTPQTPQALAKTTLRDLERTVSRIESLADDERQETNSATIRARNEMRKGERDFAQLYCQEATEHRIAAKRLITLKLQLQRILTTTNIAMQQVAVPRSLATIARCLNRLNSEISISRFNVISTQLGQALAKSQLKFETMNASLDIAHEPVDDELNENDIDEIDPKKEASDLYNQLQSEIELEWKEDGFDINAQPEPEKPEEAIPNTEKDTTNNT
jgi:hypothetical protein